MAGSSHSVGAGSGFTLREPTTGSTLPYGTMDKFVVATGTYAATGTIGATDDAAAWMIAFKGQAGIGSVQNDILVAERASGYVIPLTNPSGLVSLGQSTSGIPFILGTSTVSLGGSSLATPTCTSTVTTIPFQLATSTDVAEHVTTGFPRCTDLLELIHISHG